MTFRPILENAGACVARYACFLVFPLCLGVSQPLAASPYAAHTTESDSLFRQSRPAMGADVQILLYAESAGAASALFDLAFEEIERVEQLLSTYRTSSEMSRINREAARGTVHLDGELTRLLDTVFSWARRTNGAFDPSVGALLEVWGFRSARSDVPSEAELKRARERAGVEQITFSNENRTVSYAAEGLWLDTGSFGKGYALDRAAVLLQRHGIERALLESGQSTYVALGPPPNTSGWLISITDPDAPDSILGSVSLAHAALSTSGNSVRRVIYNGREYAHIIDPRSGVPVDHMKLATILAHNGLMSDILSTAAFVMGLESGTIFIESVSEARGLLLEGSGANRRISRIHWDAP